MSSSNSLDGLHGWRAGYDPVYLDPFVCHAEKPSRSYRTQRTPEGQASDLLRTFLEALKVRPENAKDFLDAQGYGTRFQLNRELQRQIGDILNNIPGELKGKRYFQSVSELLSQQDELLKCAGSGKDGCFVVVNAMIATRVRAPEEIGRALPQVDRILGDSPRAIASLLTDHPGPIVTLEDPLIGIMTDSGTFWNWTPNFETILSPGWYPFVSAVGMFTSPSAGRPYIDLLALLARPYPSLDTVLPVPTQSTGTDGSNSLLEQVLKESLIPEVQRLDEQLRTAPTPPSAASTATCMWQVYPFDKKFLEPLYAFRLCCELNRVGWRSLAARAPLAYQIVKAYMEQLEKLAKQLDQLKVASLIIGQDTNIETYLKEPEVRREIVSRPDRL